MAKLDDEHRGAVTTVEYKDFSGGLNTTTTPEQIAPNELAKAINVEMDSTSGCLKTVAGTDIILQKQQAKGVAFTYLMYDSIGKNLLVVDSDRKVCATPLNGTMQLTEVGSIDGLGSIEYTAWEDGIVITSGGKLQYYHNGTLETINDEGAPTNCHSPFIKNGRIYLGIGDELHASAIGDEHSWITDSNDASSAQWLQIGYKDGGNIVGLGSLSSDMVIFKDNHRAYHLAGAYPNWSLNEIGRQIDCKGFNSCVSLADQVLALGQDSLQTIRTTDQYGDMRSANVSAKVQKDIAQMGNIRLRYMPSLNQVWMINGARRFFFVDMNNGGFYQREYMSEVYDAVEADGQIYIIKADKLCRLNSRHMSDDGEYLRWRIQGKTMTTINQFLVKRSWVDTVPLFDNYTALMTDTLLEEV